MHLIKLLNTKTLVLLLLLLPSIAWSSEQRTLLVVGDSLSAAYGIESGADWVSLLEKRLNQTDANWQVKNASISGETTGGALDRFPELLTRHQPDLIIIELGGNDGLRGFSPKHIRENLAAMIEQSQPEAEVLLLGMQIPPNYGKAYTTAFRKIFVNLAEDYDTALVPFLLADIYDQKGMMQADGIHPEAAAQSQMLDNVWPELKPLLDY